MNTSNKPSPKQDKSNQQNTQKAFTKKKPLKPPQFTVQDSSSQLPRPAQLIKQISQASEYFNQLQREYQHYHQNQKPRYKQVTSEIKHNTEQESPYRRLQQQQEQSHQKINDFTLSMTDNFLKHLKSQQSIHIDSRAKADQPEKVTFAKVDSQYNPNLTQSKNYMNSLQQQQAQKKHLQHKRLSRSQRRKKASQQFQPFTNQNVRQPISLPFPNSFNTNNIQQPKLKDIQRPSFTVPQNQKQELLFEDEMDLKKQFIFIFILAFIFVHIYYAMVYQLEYFTVVNLFFIMLWVTISPHHQEKLHIKKDSKEFQKVLYNFVKAKAYHLSVNRPIFRLVFVNFVVVDLGLLKLVIGKLGIFSSLVSNSPIITTFMQDYVNTNFINLMQKVTTTSYQYLINNLSTPQIISQNPNEFILISIFKFISKLFYWLYVGLATLWTFIYQFMTEIAFDGKYFAYLTLLVLCGVLAFKNFFKVSQRIEKVIDHALSQDKQPLSQANKALKEQIKTPRTEHVIFQQPKPARQNFKVQKKMSMLTQERKKFRISAVGSNYSSTEQPFKKTLDETQDSPVYVQLSKYLLISSLLFMYAFCFLAEDTQMLISQISVKQAWSLVVCIYAFLIVEYCKRNQKFVFKDKRDQLKFRIKCNVVKIMVTILILHDFFISKRVCQDIEPQSNIVKSFQCFEQQSRYVYFFKSFFYNPHITEDPSDSSPSFKLNIFLDFSMKIIILINFRLDKFYLFKNKRLYPLPDEQHKLVDDRESSVENMNLGESIYTNMTIGGVSTQSYKLKKKFTAISRTLERNTIVLLIVTILVMTLTNSISNIIVLLGTFVDIPSFDDSRFRKFLMIGLTFGLLLQPNQFLYFLLSLLMISIRGKNYNFAQHSHWLLIQFSRMYILFSKVSVINFLMGLVPSAALVMYCLGFRIVFNYFGWISVFMGTEDNYTKVYCYGLVPHSVFVDVALWVFMILFKTYTPNLVQKFKDCDITDIFKQYPVIQKIQPILKILKIIQLIAYVATELIVFTQTPSIIVFIRLFMHLVIAAVDLAYEKANQTLKNLWKANLYVSLFIAFLKYFYLLKRYQNLSMWLIALLEPLQRNWSIIGLWPYEGSENILSLMVMFLPDLCIIILSMLVVYTLQVKIFESYRQVFIQNIPPKLEHQDSNSQENGIVTNKIQLASKMSSSIESQVVIKPKQPQIFFIQEKKKQKDIQYLYKNYIKELRFKFKPTSVMGMILSDFLYDTYFLLFCIVYLLLQNKSTFSGFWLNLPHFIIAYVIFIHQQDRKLPKKTFNYSIIYCCVTILLLYLKYLHSYVTYEQGQANLLEQRDEISFFKLSDILNKYILFLLGCLFYKLHDALKEQLETAKEQAKVQERRKNMVYMLLMPAFEKVYEQIKQITILWANLAKSCILAIFIANCFTSLPNFIFNLFMVAFLFLTIKFPSFFHYHDLQNTLMHYWIYPFLMSFCFTIWNQDLLGYLGLIAVRAYMVFYMEYQLQINAQNCQYVSESQMNLVERVDNKFERIDKLSIIAEEKEGVSKMNQSSEEGNGRRTWPLSILYQTILLVLPHGCLILMLCSQLVLYKNYLSAVMSLSILAIFFYSVKFIQDKAIFSEKMRKKIKIYFVINFVVNFFISGHLDVDISHNPRVHIRLGVFLLCVGFFYFMYLAEKGDVQEQHMFLISRHLRITFMGHRYDEILRYWEKKRQLVSQLGSQIHNQKKLLKLQKFYISKQKISRRVQKLTQDIQQRGRTNFKKNMHSASDFEVIDQILDYKQQNTQYELFSNMLLVLSIEDLQYCLEMMNHYYRPCLQKRSGALVGSRGFEEGNHSALEVSENMAQEMKEIRTNVLNVYHGSIYLAFKQYKQSLRAQMRHKTIQSSIHFRESQNNKLFSQHNKHQSYQMHENDDFDSVSDEQELVDFEKSELMNQKYVKCMERIHQKSMEIGWIWRKIIQNSQIISMVIVTGWNFFGGVYAIPANFAIFTWALVLQTKTTVFLWSFFFLYSGFIIICKFLLPQLPQFPVLNFIFYYYSNSCYYETIIIVISSLQIFLIKLGGTEYKSYSQRESIYDAFYRKSLNKAAHKIKSQLEQQFIQAYKILSQPSQHSFFYRVFSKSRLKPGKDFYPLMSGIQLLILMYVFFFYDMMEFESRNNRKSLGEILTVNQFSKNMMIVLFTQVIIMVVDRCIASLNFIDAKNQALQNFLLNFAFSDHIKHRVPKDVTHVGFFDFLLILKYFFHIFLMLIVNFFVYFYIPSSGFQKSLIPQCQNAICGKSYTYLSIFLLLYLAYFVVSGLQIKHGFSRDKCRNKLMERYHWTDYYMYVLFTGIPFLWEFKKICDWTITTTALPLFHWMKFEDINARLYQSKCEAEMLKIKPRAKTPLSKYVLGPVGCVFILGVVFSPLLLYSSLNPFAVKDQVLAAEVKLNLLVNGSVQYKFFSTSHSIVTQNLTKFPQSYRNQFDSNHNIKSSIDFEDNNDFYLKMSSYPDENFKISEPAIEKLCARIQRAISGKKYRFFDMMLHAKVIQKEGGENEIEWARKRLNNTELEAFIQFIQAPLLNSTLNTSTPPSSQQKTKHFKLQNFYSPIPGTIQNKTICLLTKNSGQYYELYTPNKQLNSCEEIDKLTEDQTPGILLFYSSSTKYKVGFGLLTFYVTYVLLISRLFRVYLTGNLDNVIYEGCNLERMLILCDAVREARILENLEKEEYLYAFLVDLMRNPRTLKEMSGEFTQLRKKLPLQ